MVLNQDNYYLTVSIQGRSLLSESSARTFAKPSDDRLYSLGVVYLNEIPLLPKSIFDRDVIAFLSNFSLKDIPTYVAFQDQGQGYEPDYCHVSAKHIAQMNGGQRVHGWALWQFSEMVLADFHSIWRNPQGQLIDVTPPKWGESRVFFVPDPSLQITASGDEQHLFCNRSSDRDRPFYFNGQPVLDQRVSISNKHPHLAKYCSKLGLKSTSML